MVPRLNFSWLEKIRLTRLRADLLRENTDGQESENELKMATAFQNNLPEANFRITTDQQGYSGGNRAGRAIPSRSKAQHPCRRIGANPRHHNRDPVGPSAQERNRSRPGPRHHHLEGPREHPKSRALPGIFYPPRVRRARSLTRKIGYYRLGMYWNRL